MVSARRYNRATMIVRWTAFLLVLVLTWAGFSTQARAQGVAEPSPAVLEQSALAEVAAAHGPAVDDPSPLETGAQAQPEGLADLPVVILHRPPATVPAAGHGWPGAAGFAGWVSTCLEGLQRPPCAA